MHPEKHLEKIIPLLEQKRADFNHILILKELKDHGTSISIPQFMTALQMTHDLYPESKSVLDFLSEWTEGRKIIFDLLTDSELLSHPSFLPKIMAHLSRRQSLNTSTIFASLRASKSFYTPSFVSSLLVQISSGPFANTSGLFWLAKNGLHGIRIIRTLLSKTSKSQLLYRDEFLSTLLAQIPSGPDTNTSALSWLLVHPLGIKILRHQLQIARKSFKTSLLSHPNFLSTLLPPLASTPEDIEQGPSRLDWLLEPSGEYEALQGLLAIDSVNPILLSHPDFLLALLTKRTIDQNPHISPLVLMMSSFTGIKILRGLLANPTFIADFLSHPSLLNSLLVVNVDGFDYFSTSVLDILVLFPEGMEVLQHLLTNSALLQACVYNSEFIGFITNKPQTLTVFCEALLANHRINGSASVLSMLLETSYRSLVVKQLMENPATKAAILNHFFLSNPDLQLDWLFTNEAGFSLFTDLLRHHRLELLQGISSSSPRKLFNQPQIRQLIRMGQIDPNLFLFILATGSSDAEFVAGLENKTFSLWATTARGYSLSDVIDASSLDEDTKSRRKQHLSDALQRYTRRISDTNFIIHPHNLGTVHSQPPDDALPPSLPEAVPAEFTIDGLLDIEIQSFTQHIHWILHQPSLKAYHEAFSALWLNTTIRNSTDFPVISNQLKTLCAWMNHYVLNELPIPEPYPDWIDSLKLCDDGVTNTFGEMFNEFSNQPALATYLQQVQSDTIARYNALFSTPSNVEVHIPKNAIQAEMGLASSIPRYDVYLRMWNRTQRRWVAQSAMETLVNPDVLIKCLTDSLVINTQLPTSTEGATTLLSHSMLDEKYPDYRRSPLFAKPFSLREFYAFIADTSKDDERLETSIPLRSDLIEALKTKAESFLTEQRIITTSKITNLLNKLLWRFLTITDLEKISTSEQKVYDGLLLKLTSATDGPAFIKQCIESHQEEIDHINIDNFLRSSQGAPSVFSTLIANPFYAGWLFGFKLIITQVEEKPLIHFQPEASELPSLAKALISSEKTSIALESILNQPGTLFLWLYYFQGDATRNELFQAILSFLLSTPKSLYAYDALYPLLYDMQLSPTVSDFNKVLVQTFLEARLSEQLTLENEDCWLTACNITTLHNQSERIMNQLRSNQWLLSTLNKPKNLDAFCYLVNDDPRIIDDMLTLRGEQTRSEDSAATMEVDSPETTARTRRSQFFQPRKNEHHKHKIDEEDQQKHKKGH